MPRAKCQDCGRLLSRKGAVRCRTCANRVKAGNFTPDSARAAVTAREAKRKADKAELEQLRREAGR